MGADSVDHLRRWARGITATEAATELLIRSFGGRFARAGNPWVRSDPDGQTWIEWECIPDSIGALSGGEQRLLRITASIGGGVLVDLGGALSLDERHSGLVLAAVAHAGGYGDLHPWPT